MSELTDEIVNKGLAKLMGYEVVTWNEPHIQGTALFNKEKQEFITGNYYTESLDALVPVWKKLEEKGVMFLICTYIASYGANIEVRKANPYEFEWWFTVEYPDKTIQQAAAYATYKAIKELSTKEIDEESNKSN